MRNPDNPQPAVKTDDTRCNRAGTFKPEMFQPFDRLQIVTVQQILDGARMNLPLIEEVTKKARRSVSDGSDTQERLIPEF